MGQFDNYQPNKEVLRKLKQLTLVAVVGASGVGKTTLMRAALQADSTLQFVVTDVSRPPRPEERDGIDYNFCNKQDMLARAAKHEYVNMAQGLHGDIYATDPASFPLRGIGVMAIWAGVVPYFRSLPFKAVHTVYIVPVNYAVWQQRIGAHQFTPQQRASRLAEARESLTFGLHDAQTVLIVNDNLQKATQDFLQVAHDLPPLTDQQQARAAIRTILAHL